MSETQSRKVGAYVVENPPLHYMYILGLIALVIGVVTAAIASANAASVYGGGVGAVAWQFVGGALAFSGLLTLIAAGMAHSINWQILNR
jgi:hypothetical protein